MHTGELQLTAVLSELNHTNRHYAAAEDSLSKNDELRALIGDCIAQSRTAQKKLYDKYSPAAYGIIRRYMYPDESAAQEILNDAFFKIFTKLSQYSFQGAFEGWIRKVVVNTIADYVKRNVKVKVSGNELKQDDVPVKNDTVSGMSYKELLKLVHELPDVQRIVFNLFVFEDYSHRDIATILKINENNSRWFLNDARNRLKQRLNTLMK